ncbi:MAG: hypothetical protein KAI99_09640, partial [Cyclobacteriaceae bacterium]|nr:hypothetical protein [Cyclobacteriaceae bacterium]
MSTEGGIPAPISINFPEVIFKESFLMLIKSNTWPIYMHQMLKLQQAYFTYLVPARKLYHASLRAQ